MILYRFLCAVVFLCVIFSQTEVFAKRGQVDVDGISEDDQGAAKRQRVDDISKRISESDHTVVRKLHLRNVANGEGSRGWTPLLEALSNYKAEFVDALLAAGAFPCVDDESAQSVLFFANQAGRHDITDPLIEKAVTATNANKIREMAFGVLFERCLANPNKDLNQLHSLARAGIDFEELTQKFQYYKKAVQCSRADLLQVYIDAGWGVDFYCTKHNAAMHPFYYAIFERPRDVVDAPNTNLANFVTCCYGMGISPHYTDGGVVSEFEITLKRGRADVVEAFINAGVFKDSDIYSATDALTFVMNWMGTEIYFFHADYEKHCKNICTLVGNGARISNDSEGVKKVVFETFQHDDVSTLKILVSAGLNLSQATDGKYHYSETLKMLVERSQDDDELALLNVVRYFLNENITMEPEIKKVFEGYVRTVAATDE